MKISSCIVEISSTEQNTIWKNATSPTFLGGEFKTRGHIFGCNKLIDASPTIYISGRDITHGIISTFPCLFFLLSLAL